MITNDSRYAKAVHEFAQAHLYDEFGVVETTDSKPTVVSRDTVYLLPTAQLSVPPRQYMVKETDNVQLLAYRTLQDPTQWWTIADANPHIRYPMDMTMGDLIHLPE